MDITQLRYFLKTAELLNYTRAAEALFITRQSLRQAIAGLEKEIGQPLFLNTRNKLSLTEYGAYLAVSGAKAVRAFDEIGEGLRRLCEKKTALRVAFSRSLFPFMLPDTEVILRAFASRFAHIRLDVQYMENDAVIGAAMRGEIDCGCVVQMPCERVGCAMRVLQTFPAAVDIRPDSPFAGRKEVELHELAGHSMIGMGSLETTLYPVYAACRAQGIEFPYQVVPSTIDAFYQIDHGLAMGFDILKTDVPDFDWSRTAALKGYSWEIGFLLPAQCADASARELFLTFAQTEYAARWAQKRREWGGGD